MLSALFLLASLVRAAPPPVWADLSDLDRRFLEDAASLNEESWARSRPALKAAFLLKAKERAELRRQEVERIVSELTSAESDEDLEASESAAMLAKVDDRVAWIWRSDLQAPLSSLIESRRASLKSGQVSKRTTSAGKRVDALGTRYAAGADRFAADVDQSRQGPKTDLSNISESKLAGAIAPAAQIPPADAPVVPEPPAPADEERLLGAVIGRLRDSETGRGLIEDAGPVAIRLGGTNANWNASFTPLNGIVLNRRVVQNNSLESSAAILAEELQHSIQSQRRVKFTQEVEIEGRIKSLMVYHELTDGTGVRIDRDFQEADQDNNHLLTYLNGGHPEPIGYSTKDGIPGLEQSIRERYDDVRLYIFGWKTPFRAPNSKPLSESWMEADEVERAKDAQEHFQRVMVEYVEWRRRRPRPE